MRKLQVRHPEQDANSPCDLPSPQIPFPSAEPLFKPISPDTEERTQMHTEEGQHNGTVCDLHAQRTIEDGKCDARIDASEYTCA